MCSKSQLILRDVQSHVTTSTMKIHSSSEIMSPIISPQTFLKSLYIPFLSSLPASSGRVVCIFKILYEWNQAGCTPAFFLSSFTQHNYFRSIQVVASITVHCFLLPSRIPLFGNTTVCLSTHQLMGICLFPLCAYFELDCYVHSLTNFCVNTCLHLSWVNIQERRAWSIWQVHA